MLAYLAAVLGVIAALLNYIGGHASAVTWLVIVAVILLAVHCCAYGRPWYRVGRSAP